MSEETKAAARKRRDEIVDAHDKFLDMSLDEGSLFELLHHEILGEKTSIYDYFEKRKQQVQRWSEYGHGGY